MNWRGVLKRLQPRILRRKQDERDLEDELQFDLEQETKLRAERGQPVDAAKHSAQREFGNLMLIKEATREMWGWTSLERFIHDTRFAWRMSRKSPALTLVAIASLAIGIGANTAIFSLVDAILLRSLAVRDPQQLRLLLWTGEPRLPMHGGSGYTTELHGRKVHSSFSYPVWQLLSRTVPQFSDVMGFAHERVTIAAAGDSHYAQAFFVTGNFFSGLGVNPLIGRTISREDDRAAAPVVAAVSYAYWEQHLGLDAAVVGRKITVDGKPVILIGVTPRAFTGVAPGQTADLFMPMAHVENFGGRWYLLGKEDRWWVQILARLRTGVSERQAQGAVDVVMARAAAAYPEKPEQKRDPFHVVLEAGEGGVPLMRGHAQGPLLILSIVVGLVLLIACANIANLLLARGVARRREIAVRLSIGAGRARLVRQLLTESLLLSGAGAVLGLIFASPLAKGILAMVAGDEPMVANVQIDVRTLLFTAGIAILTAVVFGLVPAFRSTRIDLTPALKDGSAGAGGARGQLRLSRILVMSQVALSVLLLTGAGLFVRTLVNLSRMDPGFQPHHLLIFSIDASRSGYREGRLADFYERVRTRMAALPGVEAVTLSSVPLVGNSMWNTDIVVPGFKAANGHATMTYNMAVGPHFLTIVGMPVLLGRDINDRDSGAGPRVAVVNDTFVRTYFAGQNPIGKVYYEGSLMEGEKLDPKNAIQIVGVSKDAKYDNLKHEIPPTAYLPLAQTEWRSQMTFEIRTPLAPGALAHAIRQAVAGIDPNVPVADMRTQDEQIRLTLSMERAFAALVGSFGLIAALLAAIGLYGVMAYAVTRRTAEIGIRVALGAGRSDVQWMVLRDSLWMVAIGMAVGIPAALALTRLLREALYGIAPDDPVSFAAAGVLMAAVAGLAAWIPALRAARVEPMRALRYE